MHGVRLWSGAGFRLLIAVALGFVSALTAIWIGIFGLLGGILYFVARGK